MNKHTNDQAMDQPNHGHKQDATTDTQPETGQVPGSELTIYDPGRDAGAGMENISRDEYAIPFIRVLDAKSPQCKPVAAGGVPGAKAGSIFNVSTGEVYDGEKGIEFIPVHRDHNFGEWIPRDESGGGGGFVGIRAHDDPLVLELRAKNGQFGKLPTSDGHELVEAFYIYGLLVADGMASPVLISFTSTQIKKYKNFMTRVMGIQYQGPQGMVRPPMWAHRWRLTTGYESKGTFSWYGWKIALVEEPPIKSRLKLNDPLYVQGRELYETIKSGRAVVKHDANEPGTDKDIPF